ncbi:MAG: DUF5110 domain-containing protein, partial [Anaerolineae bacterium]|nr:DUF5110 domain-containing protein [Anaerolineae bacterium]
GDNRSTWDHLHLSIQMVLNLGLSGVPITGPDLGGFTGGPSPELFARWMQVGAFTPFYRAHSMTGSPDQEPWALGDEVEAISRKYLELRYRLLPYLYTAAWQAAQYGWPLMRSMSFVYPEDTSTYGMDDQYLFGDAFLVAPVLEERGRQREIYLPAGKWYDFWTGAIHDLPDSQTITANAPLDVLPLFVKGGAIIPLWPVQQYVGEKSLDTLTFYAYPAAGENHSYLYEDDGVTPHYQNESAHRLSRLTLKMTKQETISIACRTESGQYESPAGQIELHVMGIAEQPKQVKASGTTVQNQRYDAEQGRLILTLDAAYDFESRINL